MDLTLLVRFSAWKIGTSSEIRPPADAMSRPPPICSVLSKNQVAAGPEDGRKEGVREVVAR